MATVVSIRRNMVQAINTNCMIDSINTNQLVIEHIFNFDHDRIVIHFVDYTISI
uniref:Hypotheticial protein n=1 Tax=Schistosoma japonicum TaxID=6182 RepID=C1LHC2_SCHJA|nr:hypotheticial protein [Schistosoma japonicum]